MITIDQLLESVDLYFEPRWVAKSHGGCVTISDVKPVQQKNGIWWFSDYGYSTVCIWHIKLSEFDGKDWTECIYEVPRKTTGKIEKLGKLNVSGTNMTMNQSVVDRVVNALNQVIDAVNELKEKNNG